MQGERPRDRDLGRPDLLIQHRSVLGEIPRRGVDDQVTLGIDREALGSIELDADRIRVRARGDDEVIFQASAGAVIDHVNAGVHIAIGDLGIRRDICMPLGAIASDEIVAHPGRPTQPLDRRLRVPSDQRDRDNRAKIRAVGRGEAHNRAVACEEQSVAVASREIACPSVGLAKVGLETDRPVPEPRDHGEAVCVGRRIEEIARSSVEKTAGLQCFDGE